MTSSTKPEVHNVLYTGTTQATRTGNLGLIPVNVWRYERLSVWLGRSDGAAGVGEGAVPPGGLHRARPAADLRDHALLRGLPHGQDARQEDDRALQAQQGTAVQAVPLRLRPACSQVGARHGRRTEAVIARAGRGCCAHESAQGHELAQVRLRGRASLYWAHWWPVPWTRMPARPISWLQRRRRRGLTKARFDITTTTTATTTIASFPGQPR